MSRSSKTFATVSLAAAALALPAPALADDGFEFWLNPSVATDLDDDTTIELETAQRFRSAADRRVDTYFFRLWVAQDVAEGVTLSGALEQRINDGGADERRVIQQLTARQGMLRGRLRLEQRFVEGNGGRMGLRVRPRLGLNVPLDAEGRWAAWGDAELMLTLRATSAAGDTGLTGLRTQIGIEHEVSDTLSVSLAYLRNEEIRPGRANPVGHAPLVGLEFSF